MPTFKKLGRSQINYLIMHLKILRKQEQAKPKKEGKEKNVKDQSIN
jgi:hypothetical protein